MRFLCVCPTKGCEYYIEVDSDEIEHRPKELGFGRDDQSKVDSMDFRCEHGVDSNNKKACLVCRPATPKE